jgi:uncharacterized membrane protein YeaQ/YmgE (transglycosylase-associated protein family)
MSLFVWSMVGIALWHFAIFVPDRFLGGIVGAFLAGWLGALVSGFLFEGLDVSSHNPPGLVHTLYALPGAVVGLVFCYVAGSRRTRMPRRPSARSGGASARA